MPFFAAVSCSIDEPLRGAQREVTKAILEGQQRLCEAECACVDLEVSLETVRASKRCATLGRAVSTPTRGAFVVLPFRNPNLDLW